MSSTAKLQQQRRQQIDRQKRDILSRIDANNRRMFGVITQFAAELVWQYVDGLCDALASSKEDFKLQCRRLRDLRRSFNAKRNQILVNEDEQHLINLAELYQDCFDQQINKLVLNVNLYYKHLPLSERLLAVGLEQVIITYGAEMRQALPTPYPRRVLPNPAYRGPDALGQRVRQPHIVPQCNHQHP